MVFLFPFQQKTDLVFDLGPNLKLAPKVSKSGEVLNRALCYRFRNHGPPLTDHLK
jgi:hypothetical protein